MSTGEPLPSGFVAGGNLVTGEHWQASVDPQCSRGSSSTSNVQAIDRADRRSPRQTPPKRTCRDVTSSVLHGGQLDFSGMEVSDFPVALDATNILVPSSQESTLAAMAQNPLNISGRSSASSVTAVVAESSAQELPCLPEDAVRCAQFNCPWCDFSSRVTSGLMCHITRRHEGAILDDTATAYFHGLGRGTCACCGTFRDMRSRTCHRCASSGVPRAVQTGDSVQLGPVRMIEEMTLADADPTIDASAEDPALVAVSRDGAGAVTDPANSRPLANTASVNSRPGSSTRPSFTYQRGEFTRLTRQHRGRCPSLPGDFESRLRLLPNISEPHIPKSLRERICAVASDCLEGLLDKDNNWALLCEGVSKLLLAKTPYGVSAQVEMARRLALWEGGDIAISLAYVEAQASQCEERLLQRGGQDEADIRAKRARALTKEGAYAKAVGGLKGGLKSFTREEQTSWATKLIPQSDLGDAAFSRPCTIAAQPLLHSEQSHHFPDNPLKGIRFPQMSGPGPSGARPEHTRELLSIRKRSVANRYLRLLGKLIDSGLDGTLPSTAKWILGSQLAFIDKKGSSVPRPMRAGEYLRKIIGKSLLQRFAPLIKKLMLEFGQFGVSVPGGIDVLIHARSTIEDLACKGVIDPLVVVDADLINCFGMFEWPSIVGSTTSFLPEVKPWLEWCSQDAADIKLPCGDTVASIEPRCWPG